MFITKLVVNLWYVQECSSIARAMFAYLKFSVSEFGIPKSFGISRNISKISDLCNFKIHKLN